MTGDNAMQVFNKTLSGSADRKSATHNERKQTGKSIKRASI